jgi:hypothetical protein
MTALLTDYSRRILDLYARLPGTPRKPRPADRRLIEQLHSRGVSAATVEAALFLAAARRVCRNPSKPPLPQIRSLAYFLPVIDELLETPLPNGYLAFVQSKVALKPPP